MLLSAIDNHNMNGLTLVSNLSTIRDAREPWKIIHQLSDIIFSAITATIAWPKKLEDIEDFGADNLK
jgi:hypothetical protein